MDNEIDEIITNSMWNPVETTNGVKVYSTKTKYSIMDAYLFECTTIYYSKEQILNFIWNIYKNHTNISKYDSNIVKFDVLQSYFDGNGVEIMKIIHQLNKSPIPYLMSPRDLVYRIIKTKDSISLNSIESDCIEIPNGTTRAIIHFCRFAVYEENNCRRIQLIGLADPKGNFLPMLIYYYMKKMTVIISRLLSPGLETEFNNE